MIAMMLDLKGDTDQLRKAYHAINDELQKQGRFEGLVFHTAGPNFERVADRRPVAFARDVREVRTAHDPDRPEERHGHGDARPEMWEVENSLNVPSSSGSQSCKVLSR